MDDYKQEALDALNYSKHLKFDASHPWHRNLIALYCSILEYSESLIYLAENKKYISIPVVFRSLLEAYVDFKNLAEDKSYGNNMEAAFANDWLKVFKEASKETNPYLARISSDPLFEKQVEEQQQKLDDLREKGYQVLTIFQKFKKADMLDEYRSIYNLTCSYSHNNIRSFIERFFRINPAEDGIEISCFKDQKAGAFDEYLDTGRHFLHVSSHNIHVLLVTGYEVQFPVPPESD